MPRFRSNSSYLHFRMEKLRHRKVKGKVFQGRTPQEYWGLDMYLGNLIPKLVPLAPVACCPVTWHTVAYKMCVCVYSRACVHMRRQPCL